MEVGRYWARAQTVSTKHRSAPGATGKGASMIRLPDRPDDAGRDTYWDLPDQFVVMHENWPTWQIFQHCCDQWHLVFVPTAGGGSLPIYQSFNLQSVESALRCFNVRSSQRKRIFRHIKYVIDGAKSILNGNGKENTDNAGHKR